MDILKREIYLYLLVIVLLNYMMFSSCHYQGEIWLYMRPQHVEVHV